MKKQIIKKNKNLTNYQVLKELPFFLKKPKKLTKHQILQKILLHYEMVGISRAQRDYAETYNIEVTDRESLSDSLFLAESSIIDLFSDLLEEKRYFKYNLFATITLKRWNNAINRYDIETIYIRSDAVTVTNKRFNLGISYEKFKNILNIWCGEDSGWIVDKIEGLCIDTANYDQLVGTIYISLPIKLNNPQKRFK